MIKTLKQNLCGRRQAKLPVIDGHRNKMRERSIISGILGLALISALSADPAAAQVFATDTSQGNACTNTGRMLGTGNFFTDFDNGTFGVRQAGDPATEFSPASNPYSSPISGTYQQYVGRTAANQFNSPGYGEYSFVGNIVTARNSFQHEGGITDPLDPNGRFFHADPDNSIPPEFSSSLAGLPASSEVELSFWAADAELSITSPKNAISVFANGSEVFQTGLISNTSATQMTWFKYSVVVTTNAAGEIELDVRTTEAGQSGLDIHFDNLQVSLCTLPIEATNESAATSPGTDDVITVFTNDTFDSSTITATGLSNGDFSISVVTAATGTTVPALNTSDGTIDVPAGTPAAAYSITYEICETLNTFTSPAPGNRNCDTATATITVGAALIDAVNDTPVAINGTDGGTTASVLDNDLLNNVALNPADVTLATSGTASDMSTPLGFDIIPAVGSVTVDDAGQVTVAAGTTSGTYVLTYEVCEVLNTANCDIATATVSVEAENPPAASDDVMEASAPGPVSINPMTNDTGDLLDPTTVTLTGTGAPAGSILSANGKQLVVLNEGTWAVDPETGIVTFTPSAGFSGEPTPAAYVVSDVLGNSSNEAKVSVAILPAVEITANDDGPIAIDGSNGGTSFESVLDNDTLNGVLVSDPSLVTIIVISVPSPPLGAISINPDGTLTAAAGTTAGSYTLTYEICEVANPTNCSTADAEILIVDTGTGLISEIEEDLQAILEEDLTQTLIIQSSQINGYSADALDRLQSRSHDACLADVNALLAIEGIRFDTDKAIIKPAVHKTLDEIAAILAGCQGSAFEIAGHTDGDASDAYNTDLSQRRVTAVLRALSDRGVDTTGYIARGYGESQPIATNATEAGKAQNRRVAFRPLETDGYHAQCAEGFSLARNIDANANESGVSFNGQFLRDQHECITDSRSVFEGTLSYLDTSNGQTQTAINLSYRREQYKGGDSVFGYFVGLYASQSDVTRLSDSEIDGRGFNAGVYGANRLENDLYLDYYLGATAGVHSFDLAFDRDFGTIDASGDYRYIAGFTGAALSGQVEFGETIVTPRVGFDYVYTPGADVDVVAALSGLSEEGSLKLDSISGGRLFGEFRTEHTVFEGDATLWINPRIACYQSVGTIDSACGVGGAIGLESLDVVDGLTYAFEFDGEWGEDYNRGLLSVSISQELEVGVIGAKSNFGTDGNANISGTYEVQF